MWFNEISTIDLTKCPATKTKRKTILQNHREFWDNFANFAELGINRYKITGDYPETLDERTILQSIFWYGSFSIFNDNGVWLSLPCAPSGGDGLTIYGYPTKLFVFGRNGYNKQIGIYQYNGDEKLTNQGIGGNIVKDKTGFWVREKKFIYPLANTAILYAERVGDSIRTLDTMRVRLKNPNVVFCQEEVKRSVEEYFKNIKDNDELVVASVGVFDPSKVDIKPMELNPESVKTVKELVEWYKAIYLSYCGINSNPASDKAERLLVDEVNANDEETDNNVNPQVDFMNEQLEKINAVTGWSIKMEVNYEQLKDIRRDTEDVYASGNLSDNGNE